MARMNPAFPTFMTLKAAMTKPHGTHGNLLVGFVGAADRVSGVMEICLCDKSALAFLRMVNFQADDTRRKLLEADVDNHLVAVKNVMMDTNMKCLVANNLSTITFIKPGSYPSLSALEEIRNGIRTDYMIYESIKLDFTTRMEHLKTISSKPIPEFQGILDRYSPMYLYDCIFHGSNLPKPKVTKEVLEQVFMYFI